MTTSTFTTTMARLPVQSVIACACYGGGDFIAQKAEKYYSIESPGKTQYNVMRTVRMGAFGLFFTGPAIYTWYKHLHKMTSVFRYKYVPIQSSAGGNSWISSLVEGGYRREAIECAPGTFKNLGIKVVFDQFFFNAAFMNAYLFLMSLLEGRSVDYAYHKCQTDFHDSWGYMVLFWFPVQCFNFTVIPSHFNGIFVMVMNVCWTTILSLLSHSRDYGAGSKDPVADAGEAECPECGGGKNGQQMSATDLLDSEAKLKQMSMRSESDRKLSDLRRQLIHRRSQIIEQVSELEGQLHQIDEVLILTDEKEMRRQKQRIEEALLLADGQSRDVSDFLKLIGAQDTQWPEMFQKGHLSKVAMAIAEKHPMVE